MVFDVFWLKVATQNDPRSPQDGSKTNSERLFFVSNFVFDFCPFWVPFWCHFGSLLAPFGEPKSSKIRTEILRSPQEVPRGAQEAPRGTQKAPKSTQKAPKSTKNEAKRHPEHQK